MCYFLFSFCQDYFFLLLSILNMKTLMKQIKQIKVKKIKIPKCIEKFIMKQELITQLEAREDIATIKPDTTPMSMDK